MYSEFLKFFNKSVQYDIYGSDYRTFIIGFGGIQFGGGLFTAFAKADIRYWEENIAEVFPEHKGGFLLFGHDWMGRCYAIDRFSEEEKILVFDPGTLEVYDIPLKFNDFINKAIPMNPNECLAIDAFMKWHKSTDGVITDIECVSYKIPPFLGGADELDNLEISSLVDYWKIIGKTAKTLRGEKEESSEDAHVTEAVEDDFFDRPYVDEDDQLMAMDDMDDSSEESEGEDFFVVQQKRAEYIKRNVDTYLEKFKKMHHKKTRASWNWCAFLFGGAWFLYRKLYKCFFLTYLITIGVGAGLMTGAIFGLEAAGLDPYRYEILFYVASVAIGLFIMIIIGTYSNAWYMKKIDKLVARGDNAQTDEDWEKAHKKGGTNIPLLIILVVLMIACAAYGALGYI